MRAGELRHRVTLKRPVRAQNASGEVLYTFEPFLTTWAAVEPLRGREYLQARMIDAEVDTRIRMRWVGGVDATMRVSWTDGSGRDHDYEIVSVLEDYTGRVEIALMCAEVLPVAVPPSIPPRAGGGVGKEVAG